MPDFLNKFADQTDPETGGPAFSNWKSGLIVALLSIGTLMGALIAAPIADKFGRKYSIVFWNIIFCIGVAILGLGTYASAADIADSYASGSGVRSPFTCSAESYA